jgi:hypothetical protein
MEDWTDYGMVDSSITPEVDPYDNGGDGSYVFPDEDYSNEGRNHPLLSFVESTTSLKDKGLFKTVSDFFGQNKELTSMLLSGIGGAVKSEEASRLYNRMRDDKLADQKRYSDSITAMKPINGGGILGEGLIKNLRGIK